MTGKLIKATMYSVLGLVLIVAACNSKDIVENSYKTLKSSEEFYVAAQGAMQQALNSGVIDKATAISLNAYAEVYKDSFQVAKVALQSYKEAVDIKDGANVLEREKLLNNALEDLSIKLTVFREAVSPYLFKKAGE